MGNISTRTEQVSADGGVFDAYLALPAARRGPGILLLQEIFGVNEFIRAKAEDLASLGYVVLAPDVFWRVERNFSVPHDEASLQAAFEVMGRFAEEVDLETKAADLVAAFEHLAALPEVSGHKSAVMGYCLGGFLAYLTAARATPDACVSYYGSGIADLTGLASDIACPVLFHFGGQDPYIPAEQVERIEEAFAGRDDVTFRVEPEAGHAFENLLAPMFSNPEAAGRSYAATKAFLAEKLF